MTLRFSFAVLATLVACSSDPIPTDSGTDTGSADVAVDSGRPCAPVCASNERCVEGSCFVVRDSGLADVGPCSGGYIVCDVPDAGPQCVDPASAEHCGGCGNRCPAGAPVCFMGRCAVPADGG